MKFNEKLLYLRKEKKLSQEQLADMLQVSRQAISKWESGQTYPEMDKLLILCKIFKCNLDELTNDEIKEIQVSNKSKNIIFNFIEDLLFMINKSITMFKSMNSKEIFKFVGEMLIIFLLVLLFQIPFNCIYNLPSAILVEFNNSFINTINILWNIIIHLIYLSFSIVLIIYIYKTRYLDKFDETRSNIRTTEKEDLQLNITENNVKDDKTILPIKSEKVKREPSVLISTLGNILTFFVKTIMFLIGLLFFAIIIMLSFAFVISIILLIQGVMYFGTIFLIGFSLLVTIVILEIIFNILFNRKNQLKRIFLMFLIGALGIGLGFAITAFEVSNTTYVNSAPSNVLFKEVSQDLPMNNKLMISEESYYNDVNYIADNSLKQIVRVKVKYYLDYAKAEIRLVNNLIIVNNNYPQNRFNLFKQLTNDLKSKKVYNYNELYRIKIDIYSSEQNIASLKEVYNKHIEEINESNNEVQNNYYEEEINRLEEQYNNLNSEYTELRDKLQEYKDTLQNLLNN